MMTMMPAELPRLDRPTALDDLGGAPGQELKPDRTAELARTIGGTGARGLDDALARVIEHRGGERHLGALDLGMARDRRIAVAVEHPQHLALGGGASVRDGVIDQRKCLPRLKVS